MDKTALDRAVYEFRCRCLGEILDLYDDVLDEVLNKRDWYHSDDNEHNKGVIRGVLENLGDYL